MRKIYYLVLLVFSLTSCQDLYIPDHLDSSTLVPLIQGDLTDGDEPFMVRVSYAQSFGSSNVTSVDDAKVFISDNLGNKASLTHLLGGFYMVEKNVFKAQAGRSYVLSVEFSDGNTFASDTVRMYAPPTIDSIYAKPAVKQYIVTDADGNESLKNIPALEVLCAVSTTDLDKNYCRFSVCALSQMLSSTLGMSQYTVYHWTSSLLINTNAEQTAGEVVDGKMVIKGKHLGYLEYKEGYATKEESAALPAGWIVTSYAYRIAPQSYTYYQKIQKQLEAKGHFFDPVSSQIKGNMHCVNQSDKLVLGLFEANSQAKKITAFYWNPYRKDYVKKELVNFVDTISTGGRSLQAPGFWVSF